MGLSSREQRRQALHLILLFNLGVAQPLYWALSQYPELFAIHRNEWLDVLILTALFSFVFPGVLVLSVWLSSLYKESLGLALHRLWLAVLSGVFVLQVFKTLHGPRLPDPSLIVLAIGVGILMMLAYHFSRSIQTYLDSPFLLVAIIIIPLVFIFFSPVSNVLRPAKRLGNPVSIKSKTPVVFLLFDELPVTALMDKDRQIDPVRYPHWAALARQSYWFRNDTTVNWETSAAVPAILTGRYPDENAKMAPTLNSYPNNLFTLFKGSYDENVLEFLTRLCPWELTNAWRRHENLLERIQSLWPDVRDIWWAVLLPSDMTTLMFFDPDFDLINKNGLISDQFHMFKSYVDSIKPVTHPTLLFFHTSLPHYPFSFLPTGQQYDIVDGSFDIEGFKRTYVEFGSDTWAVTQAYQRKLLQIGMTDKLLGLFIDKLKATGLYDQSMIIVTADHGASFRPNDQFRQLTDTNYQDILPTPLLIKRPFQHHGIVSDRNVQSIDILPTIADVLGIRIPWQMDGHSMFDRSQPERRRKVFVDPSGKRRLIFPAQIISKYKTLDEMLSVFGSDTGFERLYRIGPNPELIGKSISSIGPIHFSEARLELESPRIYDDVNPETSVVPARIKGTIYFPRSEEPRTALAIAVNDVIQATTITRGGGETQDFTAMVPPFSYHTGNNIVTVYVVLKGSGKPSLRAIKSRLTPD